MIVSLPVDLLDPFLSLMDKSFIHLVIEHLGLSGFGLWDERIVEDIEDVLTDFLEFGLNLLTIVTDGRNVFVGALGLFLLLDGGNDAPGSTSSSDDILVGNGEEVSLVDSELSAQLDDVSPSNLDD